jgi:hypothetical protein
MRRVAAALGLALSLLLPSAAAADSRPNARANSTLTGCNPYVSRPTLPGLRINPWQPPRPLLISSGRTPRRQRDSLGNGALIGAAIGAGYGSFVLVKVHRDIDSAGKVSVLPMSAGIGALVGMAIDAMR